MPFLSPEMFAVSVALAFVLGACVGSFVNCAACRLQSGESVLRGRSHCPHCGHVLGPLELVPLLSWLVQGGKCRSCAERISARYPLAELGLGLAFALVVWRYGLSLEAIEMFAFCAILLYAALVDIDTTTIPDAAIVAAIAARVLYLLFLDVFSDEDALGLAIQSLTSGLGMFFVLAAIVLVADKFAGRESMGGGDLKLFFVAGLFFGWQQGLIVVVLACVFGIVGALLTRSKGSRLRGRLIVFGPAIALACFVVMLCGQPLLSWYTELL